MFTYKVHVFSVFHFLLQSTCLIFSAVVDNDFLNVQNGEIPSHSCIHSDFLVVNSTLSPRLQCGIICNTDPVCVGFDLIKTEVMRCRLLFGFPAMIPTHTTSDQSARYQKSAENMIGMDYYCTLQLTNGYTISTICNQGIHHWVLIQRRFDGSENFWRNWADYENGFGSQESEFWMGNRNIYELTSDNFRYLRIEMMDNDCVWKYAEYSMFYIGDAVNKYRLHIGGYSGDAQDSMWYHDGMFFSTYDSDNDFATSNCGQKRRGGWWYNSCHKANLNGEYGNTDNSNGINWYYWKGFYYSMKEVRMMVRKP